MPVPLGITIFKPGLGGVPTTEDGRDLSDWAETYDDSLRDGLGCDTARIPGWVDSLEAAVDFAGRLMSSVEVDDPDGGARFRGFLFEVRLPDLDLAVSLIDMANAVIVRYTTPAGAKGTETATNALSLAQFGRKELVLNLTTVLAADAANRAATVLKPIAFPVNLETVRAGGETQEGGPYKVELIVKGWGHALGWLGTSNSAMTTAITSTQVTDLITAYNLVNAFFDTASAVVESTGFAACVYCDPDTPYLERIAMLLSVGDSLTRRVAWGFYTRAITIGPSASATPETIHYYYSKSRRELKDAQQNIMAPWKWRPDVMILNTDITDPAPPSDALATLARKYVRAVTLHIDADGTVSGDLQSDNTMSPAEMLANPVSTTPGSSTKHAAIEQRLRRAISNSTINTDNENIYDPIIGIKPSIGGSGIVHPPGSTGVSGSGSSPNLAKWLTDNSIGNAIADTDYASAHGHPYAATVHTHTPAETSGAPDDAKYIVQVAHAGLSAEQALGALATGILKSTTTTGVISIAVAGTDYSIPGHGHVNTDITNWNEAVDDRVAALLVEGANITLTYSDAGNTLTIAAAGGGTVGGTGTATRLMRWATGGANAEDSTVAKSGAGLLTLSVATAETLTITDGGTLDLNGFTLNLSSDAILAFGGRTLTLNTNSGTIAFAGSGDTVTFPSGGSVAFRDTGSAPANNMMAVWVGAYTIGGDADVQFNPSISALETTRLDTNALNLDGFAFSLAGNFTTGGALTIGTGAANKLAYYSGTNVIGQYANLIARSASAGLGIGITPTHDLHLAGDDAAKSATDVWGVTSDRRTKDDIEDYTKGLDFLEALPPVRTFVYNGKFGSEKGVRGINFVAQELIGIADDWLLWRMGKEHETDPDGSEQEVLKTNKHELPFALLNAVLDMNRRLKAHGI